jgi:hypothetical protein
LAGVEAGDQQQELAGGGGQVPGQFADAGLQVLHRHDGQILARARNQIGIQRRLIRNQYLAHVFDDRPRV